MSHIKNIYCDESSHLEHDRSKVMVLGAVVCPEEKRREVVRRVRDIKTQNGARPDFEVKWGKVSRGNLKLYQALVDYFFDDDDLRFRALVANKETLKHAQFGQTHDEWYFKMYFLLLLPLLEPQAKARVYLDIKDTQSAVKTKKLHDVLCNAKYDFNRQILNRLQTVRSNEVVLVQLTDLLIGAIASKNRGESTSEAKSELVERIRERSRLDLGRSTLPSAKKFNLFFWTGTGG